MFESILTGASYALGVISVGFLVYGFVVYITWPFRLQNDLRNEKKWHENTKEYLKASQERER